MNIESELIRLIEVDMVIKEAEEAINSLYTTLSELPQNQTPENKVLLNQQKELTINNIRAMRYFER